MLSTFLLWMISKKPMHGYELIKKIEEDGGFKVVTASRLYPILKSLTKNGLIVRENELNGRRVRKVYHITGKGQLALKNIKRCMLESELKRKFLREMAA